MEDLAVVLAKRPDSVRKMLREKRLPGRRLGNRYYLLREELLDFLRSAVP